ncbi:hypothetical protein OQ968_01645 [Mycobacterium sp. 663a-19]|uniref:hypothetical protein n=1 Tax=Mycobacterium sp. 663a-19 TaxID=2986148 RepID=UPI002D1F4C5F|nr:hypothetical protein [Mycobacterium sp. 663a-19]MEB3979963.1 hypothetical protein [Mycobacterium sp. 663a-19]
MRFADGDLCFRPIGPKGAAYVFHEQHEVKVVGGTGLELGYEMNVEPAGLGGFGMHEQASTANVIRECGEPSEDVLEQSDSQSRALMLDVHAESSQQCHRLGIAAGALARPAGKRLRVELGHAPGVVSNDAAAAVLRDAEDSRGAGRS